MNKPHSGQLIGPASYSAKHAGHVLFADVTSFRMLADLRPASSSSSIQL